VSANVRQVSGTGANVPTKGLFITGSDTGVGKTVVAAAIIRTVRAAGMRVGAYKPAVSGAVRDALSRPFWEDVEALAAAVGEPVSGDWICPQRFLAPLAPHLAARAEGASIDESLLVAGASVWAAKGLQNGESTGGVEALVVEGAGGILSPLSDRLLNVDVAVEFGYPVVIVSRQGLGAINRTLLAVEAARSRGLVVAAVVLNETEIASDEQTGREDGPINRPARDPSVPSNRPELARWLPGIPIVETGWSESRDLRNQPGFLTIEWRKLMDHGAVLVRP
jgi:dethiobiotin synthetase